MTTAELLALLRIKFSDTVEPYLASDADCVDALSRAQNTFAAETLCIFDATQTASATADDSYISLPEGTVWVKAALFGSTLLNIVTQHELDYGYFSLNKTEANSRFSDWRNKTGTPKFLVTDLGSLTCRLVPFPDTNGTVNLERYRLPVELHLTTQDPEIPIQFHRDLLSGALAYLYETTDADVYAPQEAITLFAKWQLVLDMAKVQLQTDLRRQERRLNLPAEVKFMQEKSNIIGSNQNDNT